MTDEDRRERPDNKGGFSSLSGLTSNIDDLLKKANQAKGRDGRVEAAEATVHSQDQTKKSHQVAAPKLDQRERKSSRFPLKLIAGILFAGAVIWVVSSTQNGSSIGSAVRQFWGNDPLDKGAPAAKTGPAEELDTLSFDDLLPDKSRDASSGSQETVLGTATGSNAAQPSRPSEERPQAGTNLVLGLSQIRYCLAEDIRMEGARAVTDNSNSNDIAKFNAMVRDYNSRCGSFKYRSGDLERAKREIEAFRADLVKEGNGRIRPASSELNTAGSTPAAPVKNLCKTRPKNGSILKKNVRLIDDGHRLSIENGSASDAIIKLRDASGGGLVASFFVRKSMSASLSGIPDGKYRVQFAYGDAMNRDCRSFISPVASSFNGVQTLSTERTATQIITQEVSFTLFTLSGGNVRPVDISPEEFNAD
jgi:hypothetical protein